MVFHPICLVIHLFELKSLPGDPPYFENDLLRKGAVGAIAIRRCHGSWIHDQTPELSVVSTAELIFFGASNFKLSQNDLFSVLEFDLFQLIMRHVFPCLLNENGMIIDYEENKDISKVRYQLDLIGGYLHSCIFNIKTNKNLNTCQF